MLRSEMDFAANIFAKKTLAFLVFDSNFFALLHLFSCIYCHCFCIFLIKYIFFLQMYKSLSLFWEIFTKKTYSFLLLLQPTSRQNISGVLSKDLNFRNFCFTVNFTGFDFSGQTSWDALFFLYIFVFAKFIDKIANLSLFYL